MNRSVVKHDRGVRSARWASLAFVTGGLLMAALWIIYTHVHGPTSFDQTRILLGRSTLFGSILLSVPPSLLVAAGLTILYPRLVSGAKLMARVGYALTMVGLVVPAGLDLFVWGALGPPFFVPILGLGLILLAIGSWHNPRLQRLNLDLLMLLSVFQAVAFASPFFVPILGLGLILLAIGSWHNPRLQRLNLDLLLLSVFQAVAFALALIPREISDHAGGYRIYGLFAHFLTGISWAALGLSFWRTQAASRESET
jgi:hypothetical protein